MKTVKIEVRSHHLIIQKGNSIITLAFDDRDAKDEYLSSLISKMLEEIENE